MFRRERGFSLIELMITMAILALLASVALPFAQLVEQRHKETQLREALRQIRNAIDAYKQSVKDGRIEATADESGYPPDLDTLWQGVTDRTSLETGRKLYFLRRLPRDPFYPEASSSAAETWGLRSYESPADAPAEGRDVFDVYSLSTQSGLNGRPYREW
jgi:general secretion pathway protein G